MRGNINASFRTIQRHKRTAAVRAEVKVHSGHRSGGTHFHLPPVVGGRRRVRAVWGSPEVCFLHTVTCFVCIISTSNHR